MSIIDKKDITKIVQDYIIENCENVKGEVYIEKPLSDYILNSVDLVKVVVDLEEHYNITFENEELDVGNFVAVADFIDFIYRKIK